MRGVKVKLLQRPPPAHKEKVTGIVVLACHDLEGGGSREPAGAGGLCAASGGSSRAEDEGDGRDQLYSG